MKALKVIINRFVFVANGNYLFVFQKRVEVFVDLLNSGKLENVSVDVPNTTQLVKLLDTVVIKLEGGTDADLAVLEQEEVTGN